jgi:uncharacterized protein YecT (DUF1311 family)
MAPGSTAGSEKFMERGRNGDPFLKSSLRIAALVTLMAFPVAAQETEDCATMETGDQMRTCTERQFQEVHEVMTSYVSEALDRIDAYEARLPPHLKGVAEEFEASQEAYEAYADAHCRAVAAIYRGGNREPMRQLECLTEMSVARVYEIDFLLEEMGQ